jgi:hypothetical protein
MRERCGADVDARAVSLALRSGLVEAGLVDGRSFKPTAAAAAGDGAALEAMCTTALGQVAPAELATDVATYISAVRDRNTRTHGVRAAVVRPVVTSLWTMLAGAHGFARTCAAAYRAFMTLGEVYVGVARREGVRVAMRPADRVAAVRRGRFIVELVGAGARDCASAVARVVQAAVPRYGQLDIAVRGADGNCACVAIWGSASGLLGDAFDAVRPLTIDS